MFIAFIIGYVEKILTALMYVGDTMKRRWMEDVKVMTRSIRNIVREVILKEFLCNLFTGLNPALRVARIRKAIARLEYEKAESHATKHEILEPSKPNSSVV